jgi:hypothetical protein
MRHPHAEVSTKKWCVRRELSWVPPCVVQHCKNRRAAHDACFGWEARRTYDDAHKTAAHDEEHSTPRRLAHAAEEPTPGQLSCCVHATTRACEAVLVARARNCDCSVLVWRISIVRMCVRVVGIGIVANTPHAPRHSRFAHPSAPLRYRHTWS